MDLEREKSSIESSQQTQEEAERLRKLEAEIGNIERDMAISRGMNPESVEAKTEILKIREAEQENIEIQQQLERITEQYFRLHEGFEASNEKLKALGVISAEDKKSTVMVGDYEYPIPSEQRHKYEMALVEKAKLESQK